MSCLFGVGATFHRQAGTERSADILVCGFTVLSSTVGADRSRTRKSLEPADKNVFTTPERSVPLPPRDANPSGTDQCVSRHQLQRTYLAAQRLGSTTASGVSAKLNHA